MHDKWKLPTDQTDQTAQDLRCSLDRLLGNLAVPGTQEQIDGFSRRIGELAELNGEAWVRRHAKQLLAQWKMALKMSDLDGERR